ncbi:hypothetical protein JXA48_01755 [Candidatus Woesearchaeota archaeon]|nr:hypothetical protein [Candidatus Woesearchaeota archaeon]
MKKIILLIAVLSLLTLSACSLEGDSPTWDHLQNQDPSKIHRDVGVENPDVPTTDDPRCLGQYTSDDVTYRDLEIRAKTENNIDLCYEMPDEPLVVSCPGQVTLIYYSKARCLEMLS